jgi:hypothetical protein
MFGADLEAAAAAFFAAAFVRHAAEAADAYAAGLYIDFVDDDTRRPVVTAGFNSQAGIDAALARRRGPFQRRPVPADAEEARWDFAFWSHSDLARFGDPDEDPAGAAELERWIRLNGWWYSDEEEDADLDRTLDLGDEIVDGLDQVMTAVASELQRNVIPRVLRRPLPVLLHGPVYYSRFGTAAGAANPPGVADDFAAWAERQELVDEVPEPERDTTFDWLDTRAGEWFGLALILTLIATFAWSIFRAITYEGPPTFEDARDIAYFAVVTLPLFILVALEKVRVLRGGDPGEPGRAGRLLRNQKVGVAFGVLLAASLVLTVVDPPGT